MIRAKTLIAWRAVCIAVATELRQTSLTIVKLG